jgi:hypothetical protein
MFQKEDAANSTNNKVQLKFVLVWEPVLQNIVVSKQRILSSRKGLVEEKGWIRCGSGS